MSRLLRTPFLLAAITASSMVGSGLRLGAASAIGARADCRRAHHAWPIRGFALYEGPWKFPNRRLTTILNPVTSAPLWVPARL